MKNTLLIALFCAALLVSGCSTVPKSDLATLQGTWKGRVKGDPDHPCTFVISARNFEFRDDADANVWYKGTFSLREDTTPRQYIAVIGECPFPKYIGKTSMAIYRLEDGTLSITANEPDNPAVPSAFDAPNTARMEVRRSSARAARAGNWKNWNNGQSIGSFFAIAGTARETVAVGIDGLIATRNNATGAWTTQTFAGDPDFRAIVYARNQYVIVREAGLIMTSPDGLKWTRRDSPTKSNLMGLFWDGHQYLAGGDRGTILSSPDGIQWTSRDSGSQINFYSFSYSGTRYVAVGNDGIRISSDSLAWTAPATAPTSVPFTACTWTGTEFLACGLGLDKKPTIYTSPDGGAWTLRDTTVKAPLRAAITIKGAIYIAGDSVIMKSTDGGTTWTDTYANSGGNKLFMGLASNGECLIAAGFNHNVWAMPVSAAP